jgi:hypothetical protein
LLCNTALEKVVRDAGIDITGRTEDDIEKTFIALKNLVDKID